MIEELDAMRQNDTWDNISLPLRKKAIGCKWVFKNKYCADGTLEWHNGSLGG